jgi:hypothetical protein
MIKRVCFLFLFLLIYPELVKSGDLNLFFDCKKSTLSTDFYKTNDVCHYIPMSSNPIFILNKFTNTEVNKEMAFALTENSYFKSTFKSESFRDKDYGYVKLSDSEIVKMNVIFNNESTTKKFITYHEFGHIFFVNEGLSKTEREMLSDLFALSLLISDGFTINEIIKNLKKYRKNEAIEQSTLSHYTVPALDVYNVDDVLNCSGELVCLSDVLISVKEEAMNMDYIKEKFYELLKLSEGEDYYGILLLGGDVYKGGLSSLFIKDEALDKIKSFKTIEFREVVANKDLTEKFLNLLNYDK